jgi:hypothetical protein
LVVLLALAPVASAHAENPHVIPQNAQLNARIRMSLPANGAAIFS